MLPRLNFHQPRRAVLSSSLAGYQLFYNKCKKSFKSSIIMYDDITLKQPITPEQYNNLMTVLRSLNKVSNREYENTGIIVTQTNYKDCFFNLSPNYLTVSVKLPKLLYGTNQINFTRSDAELSLKRLQNLLGIDISQAKITRIDIAYNFEVSHPIETYLKLLCSRDRMKRWTVSNESLYFKDQRKELNFYNKVVQLTDTNQPVLSKNIKKNILRYELRIKSGLNKILGHNEITCATLIDESFYRSLVGLWYNEYQAIVKLHYAPATNYGKNLTEFKKYLMMAGVEKIGASEVYYIVDSNPEFKSFPKVRYNIKKMLKNLFDEKISWDANAALVELDEKMFDVLQAAA